MRWIAEAQSRRPGSDPASHLPPPASAHVEKSKEASAFQGMPQILDFAVRFQFPFIRTVLGLNMLRCLFWFPNLHAGVDRG